MYRHSLIDHTKTSFKKRWNRSSNSRQLRTVPPKYNFLHYHWDMRGCLGGRMLYDQRPAIPTLQFISPWRSHYATMYGCPFLKWPINRSLSDLLSTVSIGPSETQGHATNSTHTMHLEQHEDQPSTEASTLAWAPTRPQSSSTSPPSIITYTSDPSLFMLPNISCSNFGHDILQLAAGYYSAFWWYMQIKLMYLLHQASQLT